MGLNYKQFLDEENAKIVGRIFKNVYRNNLSGIVSSWETARQNGERRKQESSVSLIKNAAGRPIGFRGLVRDVTERKLTEAALEAAARREKAMIENALDVICTIDAEGFFYEHQPGLF